MRHVTERDMVMLNERGWMDELCAVNHGGERRYVKGVSMDGNITCGRVCEYQDTHKEGETLATSMTSEGEICRIVAHRNKCEHTSKPNRKLKSNIRTRTRRS